MSAPSIDDIVPEALEGNGRFRILSLSGGGYRGLFSVTVLSELERRSGGDAAQSFELFAGTSIGGIVACALAAGVQVEEIRKQMLQEGAAIFGSSRWYARAWRFLLGLVTAKFATDRLEKVIDNTLGAKASMRLDQLAVPLVIPVVSYTAARGLLLCSRGAAGADASTMTLKDACLCTSAAPTYFKSHRVDVETFVDGGLVANAPDAAALGIAARHLGKALDEITMLSVGTAGARIGRASTPAFKSGVVSWLVRRKLVDLTLTAQETLSVNMAQSLLGDAHLRIDVPPSPGQQKVLALDRADPVARDTLRHLAQQAVEDAWRTRALELRTLLKGSRPPR